MYDHPKLPNYSQNLFSSKCSLLSKRISVRVRQYNFKVPICSVFVWMLYLIQCYSHKWPRTWWFITSEMYSLIVWGSQRSKIRVTLGLCSLRRLWGDPSVGLSDARGSRHSLACCCMTSVSVSSFHMPRPLCLCLPLFLDFGPEVHPDHPPRVISFCHSWHNHICQDPSSK